MIFPLGAAVLSWLSTTFLLPWSVARREQLKRRRDLFQGLMGERASIFAGVDDGKQPQHVLLDQVCGVFSGRKPVTEALRKLYEQRDSPERARDNLLTLLKVMARDVGMMLDDFNDDFILKPFTSPDHPDGSGPII